MLDVYGAREDPIPGVTGRLVSDAFADHDKVAYCPNWADAARVAAAAAAAGADELKQAAKRVRDVSRKTPTETAPHGHADSTVAPIAELQALQERVATLTAENQALRAQLAKLQAQLAV